MIVDKTQQGKLSRDRERENFEENSFPSFVRFPFGCGYKLEMHLISIFLLNDSFIKILL